MKIFQAENISFSYGKQKIFCNAGLNVAPHKITGLLGANGSGKTTFFDLMCGLTPLDSGKLINSFKKPSYLSQTLTTSPALKMSDTFNMISALTSSTASSLSDTIKKLSRWSPGMVERYERLWNKKSSICSYGEKRWFFALSLLALDSDIVILDEPTAGVDPELRYYIWQCLRGAASDGLAVFVASNNVEEIVNYCDNFYMLSELRFFEFNSAQHYLDYYKATSVDEAFINAASHSFHSKNV